MKIQTFEDILSWQKSQDLALKIYETFKNNRDYSFRDQLQRAAMSISNNIAEGYERRSNKEFKHFLFTAKGSCGELRSMLYIAEKLGYISNKQFGDLHEASIEIARLLSGLITTL